MSEHTHDGHEFCQACFDAGGPTLLEQARDAKTDTYPLLPTDRVIDPAGSPRIAIAFTRADGSVMAHSWSMRDLETVDTLTVARLIPLAIPPWLNNPSRDWPTPQSPITHRGDIAEGHEEEAETWLKGLLS